MHEFIEEKKGQIARLCRQYGVRSLEIIGSGARGNDFDVASSDADFLVEFNPIRITSPLEQFFGLRDALSEVLERHVDLIEAKAILNPYVQASVNNARELVYAA